MMSNTVVETPSCCSPSRPRTGRRIARDSLLWMRPGVSGDGWGLSTQRVSLSDCIDAQGPAVSDKKLNEDVASREEFLAISLTDNVESESHSEIEVLLQKDDEGEASGDEGSTAGGSSSDGYRESSDEDPLSPSTLTLLSPATCLSSTSSPVKCTAAPRISLEAALYNATASPSATVEEIPPAPWWWPSPQFDAPEVQVSPPEKEAEDVPNYGAPPGLSAPPGLDVKKDDRESPATAVPPGLEDSLEVHMTDIPQGVNTPSLDANFIGLPASLTCPSDNDMVPPPPTWSAEDDPVEKQSSCITSSMNGAPLPPTWWPTSPTSVTLDTTPPPPSWSADEEGLDVKEEGADGKVGLLLPPSPACPPPLEDAEVSDGTPPPPSYAAPGFESSSENLDAEAQVVIPPSPSCPPPPANAQVSNSTPPPPSYDAPGFQPPSVSPVASNSFDSLPQNVAAPPAEPPTLVLSLENLSAVTAPPSEAPKDLPKIQVSLDGLTSPTKAAPIFTAPPAYMAPGFVPQYFTEMMPPSFSPSFPPMLGGHSATTSWGQC